MLNESDAPQHYPKEDKKAAQHHKDTIAALSKDKSKLMHDLENEYAWHPGYFCSLKEFAIYLRSVIQASGRNLINQKTSVADAAYDLCQKLATKINGIATESILNYQYDFETEASEKINVINFLLRLVEDSNDDSIKSIRYWFITERDQILTQNEYFAGNKLKNEQDEEIKHTLINPDEDVISDSPLERLTSHFYATEHFLRESTGTEFSFCKGIDWYPPAGATAQEYALYLAKSFAETSAMIRKLGNFDTQPGMQSEAALYSKLENNAKKYEAMTGIDKTTSKEAKLVLIADLIEILNDYWEERPGDYLYPDTARAEIDRLKNELYIIQNPIQDSPNQNKTLFYSDADIISDSPRHFINDRLREISEHMRHCTYRDMYTLPVFSESDDSTKTKPESEVQEENLSIPEYIDYLKQQIAEIKEKLESKFEAALADLTESREQENLKATLFYLEFRLLHAQLALNTDGHGQPVATTWAGFSEIGGLQKYATKFLNQPGKVDELPWLGNRDWVLPVRDPEASVEPPYNYRNSPEIPTISADEQIFRHKYNQIPQIPPRTLWETLSNNPEKLFQPTSTSEKRQLDQLMELLQTLATDGILDMDRSPWLLEELQKNPQLTTKKFATWAIGTGLARPDIVATNTPSKSGFSQNEETHKSHLLRQQFHNESAADFSIPHLTELYKHQKYYKKTDRPGIPNAMSSFSQASYGITQVDQLIQTSRWGIEQDIYPNHYEFALENYKIMLAYFYRWGDDNDVGARELRNNYLQLITNGIKPAGFQQKKELELTQLDYFDAFMLLASEVLLAENHDEYIDPEKWHTCISTFGEQSPEENISGNNPKQILLLMNMMYLKMSEIQRQRYEWVINYTFEQVSARVSLGQQEELITIPTNSSDIYTTQEDNLINLADIALLQNVDLSNTPAWTTIQLADDVRESPPHEINGYEWHELTFDSNGHLVRKENAVWHNSKALITPERQQEQELLEKLQEATQLDLSLKNRRPELAAISAETLRDNPEAASVETITQLFTLLEVILGLQEDDGEPIDFVTILMKLGQLRTETQGAAFATAEELQKAFDTIQEQDEIDLRNLDMSALINLILISSGYASRELFFETLINTLEGIDTILSIKLVRTFEKLERERLSQWLNPEDIPKDQIFTMRTEVAELRVDLEEKYKNDPRILQIDDDLEKQKALSLLILDDLKYQTLIEESINTLLQLYTQNRTYSDSMSSMTLSMLKVEQDGGAYASRCNVDGLTLFAMLKVIDPLLPAFDSSTFGPDVDLPIPEWLEKLMKDGQWGQNSHGMCTAQNSQGSIGRVVDGTMYNGGNLALPSDKSRKDEKRTAALKYGVDFEIDKINQSDSATPPGRIRQNCVNGGSAISANAAHDAELPTVLQYITNPDHPGIAEAFICDQENPQEKRWRALEKLLQYEPKALGFYIKEDRHLGSFLRNLNEIISLCKPHGNKGNAITIFACNIIIHNGSLRDNSQLVGQVIRPTEQVKNAAIILISATKNKLIKDNEIRNRAKPYGHLLIKSDIDAIRAQNQHYRDELERKRKESEAAAQKYAQETRTNAYQLRNKSQKTTAVAARTVMAEEHIRSVADPTPYDKQKKPVHQYIRTKTEEVVFQTNATAIGAEDPLNHLVQIGSPETAQKALIALTTQDGKQLEGPALQQRLAAIQLILMQVGQLAPGASGMVMRIQKGFEKNLRQLGAGTDKSEEYVLPIEWHKLQTSAGLGQLARAARRDSLLTR